MNWFRRGNADDLKNQIALAPAAFSGHLANRLGQDDDALRLHSEDGFAN